MRLCLCACLYDTHRCSSIWGGVWGGWERERQKERKRDRERARRGIESARERKRERERAKNKERERERQSKRATELEIDRDRDRESESQREKERERGKGRERDRATEREPEALSCSVERSNPICAMQTSIEATTNPTPETHKAHTQQNRSIIMFSHKIQFHIGNAHLKTSRK